MKTTKFAANIQLSCNKRILYMKKLSYLTILGALTLVSCSTDLDFEGSQARIIKEKAEEVLGVIDPNQDWSSINNGTVTITANAPLYDIAKVQILTESPFLNENTRVLADVEVVKGQTVTLNYEAPNLYDRLIAACVDSNGHYYIKGFNLGDSQLTFASSATRTRAIMRAEEYPTAGTLKMEFSRTKTSYNAIRTIVANEAASSNNAEYKKWVNDNHINLWEGSGWENDMLWRVSEKSTGTSWTIHKDGYIYRATDAMTEDEKTNLDDMFGTFLQRDGSDSKITFGRKENREYIRNSDIVKLYNNELVSDGSTPLTVTPIWMPSSEIGKCSLYFYYYNPSAIPSGMSEADYIKTLPKFLAMSCSHAKSAANNGTDYGKGNEYLLPYYGEPENYAASKTDVSSFATTDGKLYRIRLGAQREGLDYYMTYTFGNETGQQVATIINDNDYNIATQLWQVYTTSDGYKMLYNLGGRKFLTWANSWDTPFTDIASEVKSRYFRFDDDHHIFRYNNSKALGLSWQMASKYNKFNIGSDKGTDNGEYAKWYFEEYTGNSAQAASEITLKDYNSSITAPGTVIPSGYKIGLMLRKESEGNISNYANYVKHNANGCCYSFGQLNREINNFPGHFGSGNSNSTYGGSMETDDPRTAIFSGNGRTYIAFEDGSDCQFNDLVMEIGGYDKTVLETAPEGSEEKSNGVENECLYSLEEIEGISYTLCFEDRPMEADYDMNDVVLRCRRLTGKYHNYVELSLVAAGGNDDVWIRNIQATLDEGSDLGSKEVHDLFKADYDDNGNRFVNTVKGAQKYTPRTGTYLIEEGMTIPMLLSQIYIENRSTGHTINVSKASESPYGIIIPGEFDYPMEGERITNAYTTFKNWANAASMFGDWYTMPEEELTIKMKEIIH